eukprot:6298358-Pyramimonas_sp.AAC.1
MEQPVNPRTWEAPSTCGVRALISECTKMWHERTIDTRSTKVRVVINSVKQSVDIPCKQPGVPQIPNKVHD